MNPDGLSIGDVIQSKAGRDKGKYFMVYSIIDEEFIMVVDGTLRKQSSPKKKRCKHVRKVNVQLAGVCKKLTDGVHVFDAEIRKALEEAGFGSSASATKKEG